MASLTDKMLGAAPRTVFRFKDAAGRHYSAVKLAADQFLEVKRAGVQVRQMYARPDDWLVTVPSSATTTSSMEPPVPALSAAERERRRRELLMRREGAALPPVEGSDVEAMMGVLRRARMKKGFAILYRPWQEDLAALEAQLASSQTAPPQRAYYWRLEKERVEKMIAANPGDSRITQPTVVSWSLPHIFVVANEEMKPISLCTIKMAGNYPYKYENQDVIVYEGRVGKTFSEAGVPLDDDGRPNIWYIPAGRDRDPKKVFFGGGGA
jgi:hypothetical protein